MAIASYQLTFGGAGTVDRHLVIDNSGERPEILCQNFERQLQFSPNILGLSRRTEAANDTFCICQTGSGPQFNPHIC